jgi:hypothetical protein
MQSSTLTSELPSELTLYVSQEQFETLAAVNRDLKLERTAVGELIVNLQEANPVSAILVSADNSETALKPMNN